jgi:hypothetical protein
MTHFGANSARLMSDMGRKRTLDIPTVPGTVLGKESLFVLRRLTSRRRHAWHRKLFSYLL